MRQIRDFARRIAARFHPEKIILFGSYAYGKPTYDSDVDLLVIMNTRLREVDQAVQISLAIDAPFPLDLMVRRPRTIRRRVALGDYFLQEITSRGQVLYESADQRVDRKGGARPARGRTGDSRGAEDGIRRRELSRPAVRRKVSQGRAARVGGRVSENACS
jgi:predicted nucleotidyltransferase